MKLRQSVLYEFADNSNIHASFIKRTIESLIDDEDMLEFEEDDQVLFSIKNIAIFVHFRLSNWKVILISTSS